VKSTIVLGLLALGFGVLVVTSPYWLWKEMQRSDSEQLPEWMGSARARKLRLTWIMGLLVSVGGLGLILLSFVNR
jgi:hypothetical protein